MKSEIRNPKSEIKGVMLIECLVYICVLMILLGLGFAAFYSCWDKTKSLRYHADDIARTMRAGERWRADIRSATGRIVVRPTDQGQVLEIPHGKDRVLYAFNGSDISRKMESAGQWVKVLPKVKTSQMEADHRSHVTGWRWHVELVPTRPQVRIPPVFSFEAVPSAKP